MSTDKTKRCRVWTTKRLLILLVTLLALLYGIAHTSPAVGVAHRLARGTSWEGTVWRWHLSIYGERVERALASGHIRQGQSVEEVVGKHGPFHVRELGPYQTLQPAEDGLMAFEGYTMIAKDGRLAAAGWYTCTGHVNFFDTLTEQDHSEIDTRREEQRKKLLEARNAARMAIAGTVLIDEPRNMAPFDPLRDGRMAVAGVGAYTEPGSQTQPNRE